MLEKFPAPVGCTALTFGTPVTATVDDPGELRCFTFTGANADQIRIRAIHHSGAMNPVTEVFRADGTTVCANTFGDEITCALTSNGTHTIFVRDGTGTGEGLGTARMVAQRLNDPTPCPAINFNPTGVAGSIVAGGRDRLPRRAPARSASAGASASSRPPARRP